MPHLFQIPKAIKEFNGKCPDCEARLIILGIRTGDNLLRANTDRMIRPNGLVRYICVECGTRLIRNEITGSISAFLLDEEIWEDFYV